MRVAFRAGQLALEVGEGVDDVSGLKGTVPFAHTDLSQHSGRHEPPDRLVGLWEAAAG